MKETGALDLDRTKSVSTIVELLARNVRSAAGQRPARRNVVLIAAAVALCLGAALYFGASRASAEHAYHDWPNHGKDPSNTRFQNLSRVNPHNRNKLQG